jgi:glycosyltransferase involved in cell wall biosynthesis
MTIESQSKIRLSIIVTVYSETFSLQETIERLLRKDRHYILEIILSISPRSSSACLDICDELANRYDCIRLHLQQNNPGVGWAIREGIALANGTYIALLSADLETEPEAVDRMVRKIEDTGCDVVVGNRWLKGGGFENYDPKKLVLNWVFQMVFRLLYRTGIGDLTYGFKILSRDVCTSIQWEGVLHEIFIETTVKPLKVGYHVEQIPTIWIGRKEGQSQNTFFRNFRYVKLALSVLLSRRSRIVSKTH